MVTLFGQASSSWGYADTTVTDGEWHHVALVVNRASGAISVTAYLDGVLDGSSYNPITGSTDNTKSVKVGAATGPQHLFEGEIDGVRVYNRAISRSEVQALAANRPPTATSALVTARNTNGRPVADGDDFNGASVADTHDRALDSSDDGSDAP